MKQSRFLGTVCSSHTLSLFLLLVVVVGQPVTAKTVHVFYAGGQSNAKSVWVDSIRHALTTSGVYDQVLVVGSNREGAWLRSWYGGPDIGTTDGYFSDFYNDEGTGNLQVAINSILSAGDVAKFEGFFWMQGESDSLNAETIAVYDDHFHGLLEYLSADLGGPVGVRTFNVAIGAIAVNPSAPFPLADRYPDYDPELMRAVQFAMAAGDLGMSINDTQGLARYDYWHMTPEALEGLGADMVGSFLLLPAPIPPDLPVADAGPDQAVIVPDTVQLDGSGSSDVDNDPLTYSWSITTMPIGSQATLYDSTVVRPIFVVDKLGNYIVELIVSDGKVKSVPDTITIEAASSQDNNTDGTDGADGADSTDSGGSSGGGGCHLDITHSGLERAGTWFLLAFCVLIPGVYRQLHHRNSDGPGEA